MGEDEIDLAAAADRLYAGRPEGFVAARGELAGAAREQGRRELARDIGRLRRPTTAAWLVNLLATTPGALEPLTELGDGLRGAQSRLDTDAMRSLSARRPTVLAELLDEAAGLGGDGSALSASTREQVLATLTAALADPAAEQAVTSGRLVTALSYAGFGEVEIGDAVAPSLRVVAEDGPPSAPGAHAPKASAMRPEDDPEPQPAADDEADRRRAEERQRRRSEAEQALTEAEQRLEVAEASLAQARARRAEARRAVERARASLEP